VAIVSSIGKEQTSETRCDSKDGIKIVTERTEREGGRRSSGNQRVSLKSGVPRLLSSSPRNFGENS